VCNVNGFKFFFFFCCVFVLFLMPIFVNNIKYYPFNTGFHAWRCRAKIVNLLQTLIRRSPFLFFVSRLKLVPSSPRGRCRNCRRKSTGSKVSFTFPSYTVLINTIDSLSRDRDSVTIMYTSRSAISKRCSVCYIYIYIRHTTSSSFSISIHMTINNLERV